MSAVEVVNQMIQQDIVDNDTGAITAPELQSVLLAITSLFTGAEFGSLFNAFLLTLPTQLPAAAGVVWNNNGVICIS